MSNPHGGYFPGETFEVMRARCCRQDETGRALAEARAERGQWLTTEERAALNHDSRWGSDGYPVRLLGMRDARGAARGRHYTLEHPAANGTPLYKTRRDAVIAWETLLASWRALSGIEAFNAIRDGAKEPA